MGIWYADSGVESAGIAVVIVVDLIKGRLKVINIIVSLGESDQIWCFIDHRLGVIENLLGKLIVFALGVVISEVLFHLAEGSLDLLRNIVENNSQILEFKNCIVKLEL